MLNSLAQQRIARLAPPSPMGSYTPEDCVFLLKNINGLVAEQDTLQRERAIQSGTHYSAMLPVEYAPKKDYLDLFFSTLEQSAGMVAAHTATAAAKIVKERGRKVVLVSLARAGTPVGVLLTRYIRQKLGFAPPHYSISIIRDIGIDENALLYIVNRHDPAGHGENLQFIDGWTGKGVIAKTLNAAVADFNKKYGARLSSKLAVLSDPGCCAEIFGTRDDYLVPSACLNSTVSGLVSRTFFRPDIIGPDDYHGAKYYAQLKDDDLSGRFVDTVCARFNDAEPDGALVCTQFDATFSGEKQIAEIMRRFSIPDPNKVKPGVGETTRVLLRRVPWKILVKPGCARYLSHILLLARERGVPVEEYGGMAYSCCGLIRDLLAGE